MASINFYFPRIDYGIPPDRLLCPNNAEQTLVAFPLACFSSGLFSLQWTWRKLIKTYLCQGNLENVYIKEMSGVK